MTFVLDNLKIYELSYIEYDNNNYSVLVCPYCEFIVCKNCAIELIHQNLQNNHCMLCNKLFKIKNLNLPDELKKIKQKINLF